MYSISYKNKKFKKNNVSGYELINLEGFIMSSSKGFKINNQRIRNIKIIDNSLAHLLAYEKAMKKYNILINRLIEMLSSDDDGDSDNELREALNEIERFRLLIKNKYRHFLKRKELERMSKQLSALKKEIEDRLFEINYQEKNTNRKSR